MLRDKNKDLFKFYQVADTSNKIGTKKYSASSNRVRAKNDSDISYLNDRDLEWIGTTFCWGNAIQLRGGIDSIQFNVIFLSQ
jgi:hypothetical protein